MSEKENIVYQEESPDGRWSLTLFGTFGRCHNFYGFFRGIESSLPGREWFVAFGPMRPVVRHELHVKWDLPDSVCGLFVGTECYSLFRYGARRRRRRAKSVCYGKPFTEAEIAWFCAKTHIQFRS